MQAGDVVAGKYRIVRRLGEGGEGSVFLAIHMQTEMFWAIKEIHVKKDHDDASCHELEMMKRLKMRHLPQIIDVIRLDESVCLVMEHVRGVAMNRRLKNGRVLSFREVQDVAEQMAETLCYLESRDKPVCHLDIKPSNLIRRPDGLIKLVDFGSAWNEQTDARQMGTDGYAAPEQYRQGMRPDVRTDIYGLGATLYRMISGKRWSKAMRMSSVPNCPAQMSDLIRRCLMEDPKLRFQSAAELKKALERIRRTEQMEKGRRRFLGAFAIAMSAVALCIHILPAAIDLSADESWNYDKLIREAGVVSESEGQEYYRKAVFLEPESAGAYLKYLSKARTDGVFSDEEEHFLRDLLHTVRPGGDQTYEELLALAPSSYMETALEIALAYWYSFQREDNRRIALGWLEKAVFAGKDNGRGIDGTEGTQEMEDIRQSMDGTERKKADKLRNKAQLYLRMGTVLEKLSASNEEDARINAREYWEDLNGILERDAAHSLPEDPLTRLGFCRESLATLAFLSTDLIRSGVGESELTKRIRALERMAGEIHVPSGCMAIRDQMLGEIRQACEAALEIIAHEQTIPEGGQDETES